MSEQGVEASNLAITSKTNEGQELIKQNKKSTLNMPSNHANGNNGGRGIDVNEQFGTGSTNIQIMKDNDFSK